MPALIPSSSSSRNSRLATSAFQRTTKADLMEKGLVGAGSAEKRAALIRELELPEHLSANALLEVLNLLMTREAFLRTEPGEFSKQA